MIFICWSPRFFLKRRSVEDDVVELSLPGLKKFSLEELQVATNSFRNGLSSQIYRGVLRDGDSLVIVKRLRSEDTPGGVLQFQKVMAVISTAAHPNLLPLLGICITPNERLLVYPYLGVGTVASHLKGWLDQCALRPLLNWSIRKRIALGSAKGICHLHEHCNPKVIHGNVTAENIFLNDHFDVLIGDFSLAYLIDNETYIVTQVRGTIGYMPPELISNGICSAKVDVFGYGIVLLELITGEKAFDISRLSNGDEVLLLDRVKRDMKENNKLEKLVDPYLYKDYVEVEMEQLIEVAILCTNPLPVFRPRMSEVVRMVENIGLEERWDEWQNKDVSGQDMGRFVNPVAVFDSTHNLLADELSCPR